MYRVLQQTNIDRQDDFYIFKDHSGGILFNARLYSLDSCILKNDQVIPDTLGFLSRIDMKAKHYKTGRLSIHEMNDKQLVQLYKLIKDID